MARELQTQSSDEAWMSVLLTTPTESTREIQSLVARQAVYDARHRDQWMESERQRMEGELADDARRRYQLMDEPDNELFLEELLQCHRKQQGSENHPVVEGESQRRLCGGQQDPCGGQQRPGGSNALVAGSNVPVAGSNVSVASTSYAPVASTSSPVSAPVASMSSAPVASAPVRPRGEHERERPRGEQGEHEPSNECRRSRSPKKTGELYCQGESLEMQRTYERQRQTMPSCIIQQDIVKFWDFHDVVMPWGPVLSLLPQLVGRVRTIIADRGICIYKIGITHDPVHRMHNVGYGYTECGELYSQMDLLVASFPDVCSYFEIALISTYAGTAGFRNIRPGGETPPAEGLCYTYVVTQPCGNGPLRHGRRMAT